jgi:glycine oxidase
VRCWRSRCRARRCARRCGSVIGISCRATTDGCWSAPPSRSAAFDARVTAAGLHDLLDAALALAPALAGFAVVETWAGLRPGSPDGRPFLGATALEGYVVASGHFRNGILLAPITARLIADLIAGGHTDGLAPFAPDRVTAGAPAMAANQSG